MDDITDLKDLDAFFDDIGEIESAPNTVVKAKSQDNIDPSVESIYHFSKRRSINTLLTKEQQHQDQRK